MIKIVFSTCPFSLMSVCPISEVKPFNLYAFAAYGIHLLTFRHTIRNGKNNKIPTQKKFVGPDNSSYKPGFAQPKCI